jgi:hypothetical protein
MIRHQDIIDPPITIGELKQIAGTIWTDDTKTTIEPDLEDGIVQWRLRGSSGDVVTKSSADGAITINGADGTIVITVVEDDTTGLSPGEYTHIAEFIIGGHKRGLFKGIAILEEA